MRVVLTGFGPFPGAPWNPTEALVKALARKRRPALATIELATHIFATTYASVDRELPKLIAAQPDVVLMFGLAGRIRTPRIETRARNAVSVLFPDASGRKPQRNVIGRGKRPSMKSRAPFSYLLGAARTSGAPAVLSRDAGCYLCNYAYWCGLQHAPAGRPLVQFVHIPPVRRDPRPQWRARRHSPTLAALVTAAEAILIALVAASRR